MAEVTGMDKPFDPGFPDIAAVNLVLADLSGDARFRAGKSFWRQNFFHNSLCRLGRFMQILFQHRSDPCRSVDPNRGVESLHLPDRNDVNNRTGSSAT